MLANGFLLPLIYDFVIVLKRIYVVNVTDNRFKTQFVVALQFVSLKQLSRFSKNLERKTSVVSPSLLIRSKNILVFMG